MNSELRWRLTSVAALCVFVGIVGGGLALGYLSAPLDARGQVDGDWMIGALLISLTLGVATFMSIGRRAQRHEAMRVATAQAERDARVRAERAARIDALRAELRAIPELARYAAIVEQAPWVTSVEDARSREALVQRLAADPRTAPYAERAFKGETISEAQIAHWRDPQRPALCEHLQPIEAMLRGTSSRWVLVNDEHVSVYANLDAAVARLRAVGGVAFAYEIEEMLPGRASDFYSGLQTLRCGQCDCRVDGSVDGPELTG